MDFYLIIAEKAIWLFSYATTCYSDVLLLSKILVNYGFNLKQNCSTSKVYSLPLCIHKYEKTIYVQSTLSKIINIDPYYCTYLFVVFLEVPIGYKLMI